MRSAIVIIFLFAFNFASGCDVCGYYPGIIPNEKMSYAGIAYRFRSFTSNGSEVQSQLIPDRMVKTMHDPSAHVSDAAADRIAYEVYRTLEARARYFIHPRIELNTYIPFAFNHARHNDTHVFNNGIGDITLLGGYHILDNLKKNNLTHRLQAGAGVKIPTGNYKAETGGERIDPLIQTGTGSTDGYLFCSYGLLYRKFGMLVNANYKINGTNKLHEHTANSNSVFSSLFYRKKSGDYTWMPSLQFSREFSKGLYSNGIFQKGTMMNLWMGGAGLDVYYRQMGVSMSCHLPQNEEGDEFMMPARLRYSMQLTWNFSQDHFLFRSK